MVSYRKPRVLITYLEAGMGHIVSAQAIADSLKRKYGDKMEIIESYFLRDSENPILPKFERYLVNEVQRYSKYPAYGDVQVLSMHLIGAQNSLKFVHRSVFRKQTLAAIEEYAKYNADVIVCTHYFLLHAAVEYKRKYNHDAIVVSYCPDNNVHGWWDNRADCIYTNNPLATKQAYDLKFKNGHVREAFYPTRSDVSESNESKEFYRKKFGIPLDKFAVVIADGVYAKAKVEKVCLELLKTDVPLTICVLAGKNEALKKKFDALIPTTKPNITLLTFGFLKEAPQLYGACDLFITKAGPNAVLDSVMMGTPILIDYCASPIERTTKKLFVEHMFCGYHIVSPVKIRKQVETLVTRPELLNEIKEALSFFDKSKNGADEIAEDIAQILWNRRERLKKILQEEESAITEFISEKADKKIAKAEEKIETLNAKTAKKTEKIAARAQEKAQKINEKAEKAGRTVYEQKANPLSAEAASKKSKRVIAEQGQIFAEEAESVTEEAETKTPEPADI